MLAHEWERQALRNLILRADWNGFILFDDYEAAEVEATHLSSELRRELSSWNAAYRPFLTQPKSLLNAASEELQLAELDERGRALASKLKPFFPNAVIRYAGGAGGLGTVA